MDANIECSKPAKHVSKRKKSYSSSDTATTIIFSMKERVGALSASLQMFENHSITLTHIESRPAKRIPDEWDFLVTTGCSANAKNFKAALVELEKMCSTVQVLTRGSSISDDDSVPWFPRSLKDLDEFAHRILSYGAELDCDHPGFTDDVYRARRKEFADIAYNYRTGQPIPYVEYTDEEKATWRTMFNKLVELYPTHACKEFNHVFPLLIENCGYCPENIPQLQDVSDFLKSCTGFTLRPVAGLLSSRDFLAGFAFRVFHSTQYIRHQSKPLYTPEPDVCHELIGHAPLLADPDFANFCQEIGLASLGASDEWIEKLATLFWFTVEFGLCRQNNQNKVFGAGILSSFGELQYALSDEPEIKDFDADVVSTTKYPITKYQPVYFVTEDFRDAKNKLKTFSAKIPKPFTLYYDPFTQGIEIIESHEQLSKMSAHLLSDMATLNEALSKLPVGFSTA
uniref:phenylalanine 4-monooxygenase n=1 Tax=Hofstenia miamia TaxID=442651 RepID=A0A7G7LK73_HOFMI|nr:phenylalanine hydroxylase [Hofstenia miamia]